MVGGQGRVHGRDRSFVFGSADQRANADPGPPRSARGTGTDSSRAAGGERAPAGGTQHPAAIPVPAEQPAPAPNLNPAGADALPETTADSPEQRQLIYANALFGRKLYDLAVPEYEKFLGHYPNSSDRVTALFLHGPGLARA
jgi:TolA-binding protein